MGIESSDSGRTHPPSLFWRSLLLTQPQLSELFTKESLVFNLLPVERLYGLLQIFFFKLLCEWTPQGGTITPNKWQQKKGLTYYYIPIIDCNTKRKYHLLNTKKKKKKKKKTPFFKKKKKKKKKKKS